MLSMVSSAVHLEASLKSRTERFCHVICSQAVLTEIHHPVFLLSVCTYVYVYLYVYVHVYVKNVNNKNIIRMTEPIIDSLSIAKMVMRHNHDSLQDDDN